MQYDPTESLFLVAFFKFDEKGPEYGFKRMQLEYIWKTEEEARNGIGFCDEAGWFEGALIEERVYGWDHFKRGKRIWLIQQPDGEMKEIPEPPGYQNCVGLIG